jgi:sigma-B regulation protein RsbU (phosphoserine phosphatase)
MFDNIRVYTRRLAEETASKQRIEDSLKTARSIQASLLPRLFPPYLAYTDVEIVASILPGENMSGIFYDCFPVDKHHFAFVIADVAGNDVAAALFMMVVHTLVKNRAVSGYSPREVFESMNRQLCETNDQGMSATAFLGIYNSRNNVLNYVNAGHLAPLLKRATGETVWLPASPGQRLGLAPDTEYTTQVERMNPGDCLLLYTESLIEARNMQGQVFSRQTLENLVGKINTDALVPQQVIEMVEAAVLAFTGNAPRGNDITTMIVRRL